jgi:hypothetical protein
LRGPPVATHLPLSSGATSRAETVEELQEPRSRTPVAVGADYRNELLDAVARTSKELTALREQAHNTLVYERELLERQEALSEKISELRAELVREIRTQAGPRPAS